MNGGDVRLTPAQIEQLVRAHQNRRGLPVEGAVTFDVEVVDGRPVFRGATYRVLEDQEPAEGGWGRGG